MEITLSKKYLQLKVLTIKNSVPVYSFHLNESGLPSSVLSKYGWQWDFGSRSFNSYLTPISTTSTSTSVPFSVDDVITKVYCYDNQYYEDGYSPLYSFVLFSSNYSLTEQAVNAFSQVIKTVSIHSMN